jgi:glucose-6-phosphate 1-dehydrogenase
MTFRSLYRLEARGLLKCPIVGVAVNDWRVDQLKEHARQCIKDTGERIDNKVFDRFAGRLSYISGDFNDHATYTRVAEVIKCRSVPLFYLRSPILVRDCCERLDGGRPDQERPHRGGKAIRPR